MLKFGIIGCGSWGRNHIRVFSHILKEKEITCADLEKERLESIKDTFQAVKTTTDYKEIINNPDITAVCIATPAKTH